MSGQDFTASFSAGVTQTTWLDPARPVGTLGPSDLGAPSRLNPHVGRPHLRWMGVAGVAVTVTATVSSVAAPLDAALGGRLFTAWLVESPAPGPLPISHPAGQSSAQTFTPSTAGHYTFAIERSAGGKVYLHLDVEDP